MIDLRDYQCDIVERAGLAHRPCIVMPTGSGKTLVASEIIRREPDRHVLFLAHRRELVHQAAAKLREFGVNTGLIIAGEPTNAMAGVQVASLQTLWARGFRSKCIDLPPADIVFIDEAHHSRAYLSADPRCLPLCSHHRADCHTMPQGRPWARQCVRRPG
jgi:DNA repair protein RadD